MENKMRKWKRFLNQSPSKEEFDAAWKVVFGYHFEECEVLGLSGGINVGFTVRTPSSVICNGGFGYHTDDPVLKEGQSEYYRGGCTWGIDSNDERFYFLDNATGLPIDWEKVRATHTIQTYILNNKNFIEKNLITNQQ